MGIAIEKGNPRLKKATGGSIMSTKVINKKSRSGKKRKKKVKKVIPLSRSAIQHYLKMYSTTETQLCELVGISPQRYLQRFAGGLWDYQATYALCYVISSIVGDIVTPRKLCGLNNTDSDSDDSNNDNNNERQKEGAEPA